MQTRLSKQALLSNAFQNGRGYGGNNSSFVFKEKLVEIGISIRSLQDSAMSDAASTKEDYMKVCVELGKEPDSNILAVLNSAVDDSLL